MIDAVARGEAAITPATAARIIRHLSTLGGGRRASRRPTGLPLASSRSSAS